MICSPYFLSLFFRLHTLIVLFFSRVYLIVLFFTDSLYGIYMERKVQTSSPSFSLHPKCSNMSIFSTFQRLHSMFVSGISSFFYFPHAVKGNGKVWLLHISEVEVFLSRPALQFTLSPALSERSSFSTTFSSTWCFHCCLIEAILIGI